LASAAFGQLGRDRDFFVSLAAGCEAYCASRTIRNAEAEPRAHLGGALATRCLGSVPSDGRKRRGLHEFNSRHAILVREARSLIAISPTSRLQTSAATIARRARLTRSTLLEPASTLLRYGRVRNLIGLRARQLSTRPCPHIGRQSAPPPALSPPRHKRGGAGVFPSKIPIDRTPRGRRRSRWTSCAQGGGSA
jgi:hypothetical protein